MPLSQGGDVGELRKGSRSGRAVILEDIGEYDCVCETVRSAVHSAGGCGRVAKTLEEAPDCAIATAAHPIETLEIFLNPNVVKVELDGTNRAMTFSRAPIPWPRDAFKDGQKALPQALRPCTISESTLTALRF